MAKRNYGRMTADGGLSLFRPIQLNLTMPMLPFTVYPSTQSDRTLSLRSKLPREETSDTSAHSKRGGPLPGSRFRSTIVWSGAKPTVGHSDRGWLAPTASGGCNTWDQRRAPSLSTGNRARFRKRPDPPRTAGAALDTDVERGGGELAAGRLTAGVAATSQAGREAIAETFARERRGNSRRYLSYKAETPLRRVAKTWPRGLQVPAVFRIILHPAAAWWGLSD
jgi:hypothetical protein